MNGSYRGRPLFKAEETVATENMSSVLLVDDILQLGKHEKRS